MLIFILFTNCTVAEANAKRKPALFKEKAKDLTQCDKSEGEWHGKHKHSFSVCLEKQWCVERDSQGVVPDLAQISLTLLTADPPEG